MTKPQRQRQRARERPKPGDKKEAMYGKYKWYWCGTDTGGHCEQWRAHKPDACQGDAKPDNPDKKRGATDDQKKKKSNTAKKLKITKAYVAKLEQTSRDDASDDDSD